MSEKLYMSRGFSISNVKVFEKDELIEKPDFVSILVGDETDKAKVEAKTVNAEKIFNIQLKNDNIVEISEKSDKYVAYFARKKVNDEAEEAEFDDVDDSDDDSGDNSGDSDDDGSIYSEMSKNELIEELKTLGFEESDYKNLNKPELIKLLESKE